MDIITGSFHGKPATDDDDKDDFNSEENENYATLSDMMLSWEKKLYDEVKVCSRCLLLINSFGPCINCQLSLCH